MTRAANEDQPSDDAADGAERALEGLFLQGDSQELEIDSELLEAAGGDGDALLRLLALNRFAEEGLELLEERGAAVAVTEPTLGEGRCIGPYRLLKEIGAGGMGVVYLAEEERLGRLVALKVLSRSTPSTQKRFQREAEITARLQHPNIVPVYGVGESEGVPYIAMRYIAGRDIAQALSNSRNQKRTSSSASHRVAVEWILLVAEALGHAHEQGVIHRDVKPSNILVEDGRPYVLDFGLATHEGDLSITRSGDLLGTVPYMSPEQVRGDVDDLDRRSDVYSLGATLYQLLAGQPPHAGRNSQAVARRILTRDPPGLRRHGVARDLEAVVFRALEKDRERRYSTSFDFAEDLRRFLAQRPVRARHLGPLRRGARLAFRNKPLALFAAVLVVALVAAGFFAFEANRRRIMADRKAIQGADQAASRQRWTAAADRISALHERDPDFPGVRERFLRFRRLAAADRALEVIFASRVYEASRLKAELDAEGLFDDEGGTDLDRFHRVLVLGKVGREPAEIEARLEAWRKTLGDATRAWTGASLFLRSGEPSFGRDAQSVADELLAAPVRGAGDHYVAGLLLALLPGEELRAVAELDRFLDEHPADYWARFIKGGVLLELDRAAEARELYSGLIALVEDGGAKLDAALYQRALCRVREGDAQAALDDLDRLLPDAADALPRRQISRSAALFALGRLEDANAAMLGALKRLDAREFPERRGSATSNFRREETAAGYRRRVLRDLIAIALRREAFEDARSYARQLEAASEDGGLTAEISLIEIGLAEARTASDPDAASELRGEIEDLLDENPDSLHLLALRVEALRLAGADAPARASAEELVQRHPRSALARYCRALLLFRIRFAFERARSDRRFSSEAARLLKPIEDEMDEIARVAIDDLGLIGEAGTRRLEALGHANRAELAFVASTLRLWRREPGAALRGFDSLLRRHGREEVERLGLIHIFRGDALLALERDEDALLAYRSAGEVSPENAWALSRAARLALSLGNLDLVLEALDRMDAAPNLSVVRELQRSEYDAWRERPELQRYLR